jgi:hypothetical protein
MLLQKLDLASGQCERRCLRELLSIGHLLPERPEKLHKALTESIQDVRKTTGENMLP